MTAAAASLLKLLQSSPTLRDLLSCSVGGLLPILDFTFSMTGVSRLIMDNWLSGEPSNI